MNISPPAVYQTHDKPVRCPVCNARLCDTMVSPAIAVNARPHEQGVLTLKCHKCGNQIGLTIQISGIQGVIG